MTSPAQWIFNPPGFPPGAVMYTGPTVWPAAVDPVTGAAILVLGAAGGQANFPAMAVGAPGQTPELNFTVTQIAPTTPLPSPNPVVVNPAPGVFDYTIYVQQGAAGPAATNTLLTPAPVDLTGSPATGNFIGYDAAHNVAQWQTLPVAGCYNVVGIAGTGTGAGANRTLATLSIPAQGVAYVPMVWANTTTTGTVNTQIDLVVRMNGTPNSTNGIEVSRAYGQVGAITGTNPWKIGAIPEFQGLLSANAQVAPNSSITLNLNCEQQASTTDTYSTGLSTMTVYCAALPPSQL